MIYQITLLEVAHESWGCYYFTRYYYSFKQARKRGLCGGPIRLDGELAECGDLRARRPVIEAQAAEMFGINKAEGQHPGFDGMLRGSSPEREIPPMNRR